jgi:hypothetical protein
MVVKNWGLTFSTSVPGLGPDWPGIVTLVEFF